MGSFLVHLGDDLIIHCQPYGFMCRISILLRLSMMPARRAVPTPRVRCVDHHVAASVVLGKAMQSRMLSSPAKMEQSGQSKAAPWGGAPY